MIVEGPTLLTTTPVRGEFVLGKLKEMLVDMIEKGLITNEEIVRVLILSGSHGDEDSGASGLTDIAQLEHSFYTTDCRNVGLQAQPKIAKFPIPENEIPDMNIEVRKPKKILQAVCIR